MSTSLFKVALVVNDVQEAVEYFKKLFGMTEHERLETPGGDYVFLKSDTIFIELMPHNLHSDCTLGFHHICFNTPDISAEVENLKAKGAKVITEPFDAGFGITLADIEGPDNVKLRLYNRKS